MTTTYAAGILMAVVVAVRLVLWARFRNEARGRRVGVATLQLLLVITGVAVIGIKPQWTPSVFAYVLFGVVGLFLIHARHGTA